MKVLKINSRTTNRAFAYIWAPGENNLTDLIEEFKQDYSLVGALSAQGYYGRLAQAQLTHLKRTPRTTPRKHAVPTDLCEIFVEWLLQKDNFRIADPEQIGDITNTEECWFG